MNRQTFFRGAALTGLFLLGANPILAQSGSVNFANDSTCQVINGQTMAPATTGTAALYWAPTNSSSFVQIGASTPLGNPVAGYFAGGTRYTPVAGGEPGQFQVRAWMGAYATYEQAIAVPTTLVGSSVIVTLTPGNPAADPPTPPASLVAAGLLSFTLSPSVNPPLTLTCASNKSVSCVAWDFDAPTTSGGCGPITVTVISNSITGVCPQLFIRTWQATDGCDTNTCSQVVTVTDTTPPAITCASNKTVECGLPWDFDAPDATDECSLSSVIVLHTTTNGGCGNTLVATRTWLAADACGNTNSCSQSVTVMDTTAPEIICATNQVVECGQPWTFTPPTVRDNCGTNSVVITSTVTNAACGNTFTAVRTWLATDACGNTAQCTQTVAVVDTTPPELTCATNKLSLCGAEWAFDEPVASDGCSGNNLTVTIVSTATNNVCPLVVTRTWSTTDACGNSNQCSQTITVTSTSPPALACGTNKVVACTNEWSFEEPYALDACGGTNVSVEVVGTLTNSLCPLSLTRTWRATNDCNPVGVTCSQTMTVLCPGCPVLQLTKSCPIYPVPPGGTLVWTGTITNTGDITVSNIIVINSQPATNTIVFGPVTLGPGENTNFGGSYTVTTCCGPYVDTLTASGIGLEGIQFTGSATASCAGTNHITPGDMNGDGIVSQTELNAVLANYWPHSPWLYMTNAALLCDGRFQFELTNAGAWNFTVLVSTNAIDWTNLPTPAFPVYQFIDPEGTNAPQRLYHLQWP